jgi:hypothetical protein
MLLEKSELQVVLCDSLEKVLPRSNPRALDLSVPLIGFAGERASFQLAVRGRSGVDFAGRDRVRVEVTSSALVTAQVSTVELVPVEYGSPENADAGYLVTGPGLYPDLLAPARNNELVPMIGEWRAVWVDLAIDPSAVTQVIPVLARVFSGLECIAEFKLPLEVIGEQLPELDIPNSQWFHCDGLANYYGLEVFSSEHWNVIDLFLGAAREVSANAILTPVWTPPLDTGVDHYRTPTQLVGITELAPDKYRFDFTALIRWIELCRKHGFQFLEIAHLFTQWGAKATPAIYVGTPSGTERRFGWDVSATHPSYRVFLEQLIPQLREVLEAQWGLEKVLFHISDEPTLENVDGYALARTVVLDLLQDCRIVDAISDLSLYETGIVPEPIVATNHADNFLEKGLHPWLYYCVAQDTGVSNRFISQHSSVNRVIGAQLYKTGANGFLHWGFNFYNAARSLKSIDPFRDTCADRAFPGGDAFLVYPGADGQPLASIRFRVLSEAMNDLRAMQLLRDRGGSDRVSQIIDSNSDLSLSHFSADPVHYRRVFYQLAMAIGELAELPK